VKLTLAQCAEWMDGTLHIPSPYLLQKQISGYSIDTRTLAAGELFFAVTGERFDAHTFVPQAMAKGAAAAVVAAARSSTAAIRKVPRIVVDDPLPALQRLGAAVRRHWHGTLIGLTGSAGKTTTKEMTAAVLAAKYRVLKSAGNLNNHFGVPLQLLRLEPEHAYAVIEMGMSAAGEIALLAGMAAPDWGIVTNVGQAHTQSFADGIEGVARAKRELIESLDPERGIAFLNADDARVRAFEHSFAGRSVFAGMSADAQVRALHVREHGADGLTMLVEARGEQAEVCLQMLGVHNAQNALLAVAVGVEAGVPLAHAAAALAALAPGDKRGEVLRLRGAQIINDCYNSNPSALCAMIATLASVPAGRRIMVAGEMLELGTESRALHAECGEAAARAGLDWVVGVRGDAEALVEAAAKAGAQARFFATPQQAGAWLAEELKADDAVLLKASRGVRLEQALTALQRPPAAQ
jgi:UDP-N-acetylmuramoyl-tripeptide--D-alanyl-D-alanine ligase